jgi:hypothetical protein
MKKYYNSILFVISAICFIMAAVSCSDNGTEGGMPTFAKVTTAKDLNTVLTGGSMGDWIAISGTNMNSVDSVMFNDISVLPKDFYSEDSVLYVQVPVKIPQNVTDKVTLKSHSGDTSFNFKVAIPNLELTGMFNEYTQPGDTIKINGKFLQLYEVDSLNTVVKFGDKSSNVIKATDNYITAKVPLGTASNVKVSAYNSKYNVSAECPGRYRDNKWVIANYDGIGDNASSFIVQDQHNKKQRPFPVSGNYLRFNANSVTYPDGLGWLYITTNDFSYTVDMMQHPENYVLKFELNMANPIKLTSLFLYFYWAVSPEEMSGETFSVQSYGIWQTVSIPLNRIIPSNTYDGSWVDYSFNIRIQCYAPTETVDMSFDNFRICEK